MILNITKIKHFRRTDPMLSILRVRTLFWAQNDRKIKINLLIIIAKPEISLSRSYRDIFEEKSNS